MDDFICGVPEAVADGVSKWEPHTLPHCLDSYWLAVATFWLAIIVVIQYFRVAVWFGRSAAKASKRAKNIFLAKAAIFATCGLAGYGSRALAWEAPGLAAIQQVIFMIATAVACEALFWFTHGDVMSDVMFEQKVGNKLLMMDLESLTPEQIASLVREATNKHLEARRSDDGVSSK